MYNKLNNLFVALTIIVGAIVFSIPVSASTPLPKILIGTLEKGKQVRLSLTKLEAGLSLATELSGKYLMISGKEADSIAKSIASNPNEVTALVLAKRILAQEIMFVRVDRLENVLRAEIQLAHAPDYTVKSTGVGYALVRYRNEKKNEQVEDPALLLALQRAFAVAINDSAVYTLQKGSLNTVPAEPLVVGGLSYINDSSLPPWGLFQKTEVQGYDAILTIFDAAKDAKNYVCYDVDTRDSIFALFHLYMIENDKEPSTAELDALYKLEVSRYITGRIERTDSGAHIVLSLWSIQQGGSYTVLNSQEGNVSDDNIKLFRKTLTTLTKQLLGITNVK